LARQPQQLHQHHERNDPTMPLNDKIARQIAALKLDGIEQVTEAEFKVMTDQQRVKAREDGRLLELLNTPNKRPSRNS
ncbi:MAG TPA: hypothetical protein VGF32_09075, partial [Streptosporangiaceae bacterium]